MGFKSSALCHGSYPMGMLAWVQHSLSMAIVRRSTGSLRDVATHLGCLPHKRGRLSTAALPMGMHAAAFSLR